MRKYHWKRRIRLPLILLLACAANCAAQAPQTVSLTLAQAIATGIRNHPQIAIAQNLASAAGERVTEARAALLQARLDELSPATASKTANEKSKKGKPKKSAKQP